MKWHLTQLGAREKYLYPRIINNKGRLGSFSTDMWFRGIDSLPLTGKYSRLKTRFHSDLDSVNVNTKNLSSLYRMIKPYTGNSFDKWVKQGESFGNWATKQIEKAGLSSDDYIFGYTCGSLEIAKLARERNVKMVLGQCDPGFYWYDIQKAEAEKWVTDNLDLYIPNKVFKDRVLNEWSLANTIIVNSIHSKQGLINYGVDENKIKILPLVSPMLSENIFDETKNIKHKINILFVGNISFAKGFPYYAEAQKILKNDKRFEFYAVGDMHIPSEVIQKQNWNIKFTGRLNQEELSEFYKKSHILVFPTLSEGFGQVQLEAMAYGLPVIATNKCGDVVVDGVNGKIIESCSSKQIVDAILEITTNETAYNEISKKALETVEKFSFPIIQAKFWEIFK